MAFILNIETSTEVCSVALSKNGKVLFEKEEQEGLNHAELLTVFIQQLFEKNGFQKGLLEAVAVSKGPGSYTGLRIGVSVAKGLCYGLNIPLIAVNSLDALGVYTALNFQHFSAIEPTGSLLFCPMIDARRMEVYTALYNGKGIRIAPVSAEIIDEKTFRQYFEHHKICFFGNGAHKCKSIINNPGALFEGPVKNSARFMSMLSEKKYNNMEFENVAYFEPYYLKDFIATIPKNKVIK